MPLGRGHIVAGCEGLPGSEVSPWLRILGHLLVRVPGLRFGRRVIPGVCSNREYATEGISVEGDRRADPAISCAHPAASVYIAVYVALIRGAMMGDLTR